MLVHKAKSHLSFRWSRLGPNGEIDFFPASSVEAGHIPYPRRDGFPTNVSFERGDFLAWQTEKTEAYSVVTMLSVIKWIHLEGGDDGRPSPPHCLQSGVDEGDRIETIF